MFRVATSLRSRGAPRRMLSTAADVPAACFLPVEEVSTRVINVISSLKSAPAHISVNHSFGSDLGFDSLLVKDIFVRLGEEFCVDIPESTAGNLYVVNDAVKFFASQTKAR